jgi:hypothetical protein
MKANAISDDQKAERNEFLNRFNSLYNHIGDQEMNERAIKKSSKSKKSKVPFMSKNFKEEKSGGIGSFIKGIFSK